MAPIMIVGFIMFLSFVAVIIAIAYVFSNRAKFTQQQEVYTRAEVMKTSSNANGMNIAGTFNYNHSQYFIEFKEENSNKRIVLNCSKRTYEILLEGFYGDLVYKGTQLISFVRLNDHEERRQSRAQEEGYFFEKSTTRQNPIEFYCDAPTLGIKILHNNPIKLDDDEVIRYINSMFDNTTQNFFGLDNKVHIIQFFNEGNNDEILIDIPDMSRNGSYQTIIKGVNKTKLIVKAYYNNEDVKKLADFDFMQF